MKRLALLALIGCGRLSFDPRPTDNVNDAGLDGEPDAPPIDAVGTLDPTFGGTGVVIASTSADATGFELVARGSGYLAVGSDYVMGRMVLVAVGEDGAPDGSFAGTGELMAKPAAAIDAFAYGLNFQPDGSLFVLGEARVGATVDFAIGKLDAEGAFDPAFGAAGDGFVTHDVPPGGDDSARRAITVGTTTYVCGLANYNGDMAVGLLAMGADGSSDPAFQTGGFAAGQYTTGFDDCNDMFYDGTRLQAYGRVGDRAGQFSYELIGTGSSSAPIASLPTGSRVLAVAAHPDGTRVIAGQNGTAGFIRRFVPLGFLDGTFTNVDVTGDTFDDITYDSQGRYIVVGRRNNTTPFVRRYLSDGTSDASFGAAGVALLTGFTGALHGVLVDSRGRIVAAGNTGTSPRKFVLVRLQ